MTIQDSLKTALRGLRHSRLRSALTMLGIIIGTSSVIILMSIGASAERLIVKQVEDIGSNLIFVIPGATRGSRFQSPSAVQGIVVKTLVKRDLEALRKDPSILLAAPEVRGQARVSYENNDTTATFVGTTADFFVIRNIEFTSGAPFTRTDEDALARVAVLGPEIATTLFGDKNPVGKNIRLKNLTFRVVGITEKKGVGAFGVDQDNIITIPALVAQTQLLGINFYQNITVSGNPVYTIHYTESRVISILRANHNITNPEKDDFTIRNQADALSLLGNITSVLTLFLAAIASISLVVGGIGIMNIMLVSVIERTKEIGLRKALGATNRDILGQFLWESGMLTTLGGAIGIIVGAALTALAAFAIKNFTDIEWEFMLPAKAILLSASVSVITGVIFGLYPAKKAAEKNPIDALRYE